MLDRLRQLWKEFRSDTPGKRFQHRYERQHQSGKGGSSRFPYIGGGLALVAAGTFLLPAPGPGTVVLLLGAGLIAQEWAAAARALDWLELRIRSLVGWVRRAWKRSSLLVRLLIVLVALAVGGGVAYGISQLFFGR